MFRRVGPLVVAWSLGVIIGAAGIVGFQASGTLPPPPLATGVGETDSDLILTIRESYISRTAAQQVATVPSLVPLENVRVNILPNDRLRVLADVPFMGQRFQASALMSVGVVERRVRVQVQEAQLGTLLLPLDLDALFAQPINRELAALLEASQFEAVRVVTTSDRLVVSLASRSATATPR